MRASTNSTRRVVITGRGLVSPVGNSPDELWNALDSGTSGVAPLVSVPPDHLPTSYAAEARTFTGAIDDFGRLEGDLKKAVRKALKMMSRECQMGVAAALRALADAGISPGSYDPERAGVVYGSDYMLSDPQEFSAGMQRCAADRQFQFEQWGTEGLGQMNPLWLLKYLPNMPACHIAIYFDLRGPNNSITHREAASLLAVGEALRTIQRGSADLLVAGATGTRVHVMKALHNAQQEELAPAGLDPASASRPFDRDRQGMVLGEGAAALVLESLESAQRRGVPILGEVVGFGSSFVARSNSVAHRDRAMANAMSLALRDAGMAAAELGHLHAHGLSTRSCDQAEAQAIRTVLGQAADRVPVTAAKSYFGNLGAASGTVELLASLLAIEKGPLFRVLNYTTPDPACPIRVAANGDAAAGESFLTVNVTPQGQASAIVVRKFA